ncbi:MAG: hypothetical protein WBW33_34450 [Bryobacteraceae bacterium]
MNKKRQASALAVWLLRRLYPKRNREAITGDLLEVLHQGRSEGWFWREVLVAILVSASGQLRPRKAEICLAATGTASIWFIPWGLIFPTAAMSTSMNWGVRLPWLFVIETATALMVLPLFAALLHLSGTLRWANLFRVFLICASLFGAGDLLTILWCASHPVTGAAQASWTVALQVGWIFAALLISTGAARPPLSPPNAIRTRPPTTDPGTRCENPPF